MPEDQHLISTTGSQLFQSGGVFRIDELRKAIQANRVHFPVPVPIFPNQCRPDTQWRLVELYFVRNWSSRRLAERYRVTARRVQQSLQRWAECAVARGHLQEIPPETALTSPPARAWITVPTILIAAGEPHLRQLIRQSLCRTGFHLVEAPSAQAAIEMTRQRHFDLVMVNVSSSRHGEADLCRGLRNQSPSVGIIVVRAGGAEGHTEDDEWRVIEAGANDCVTAPFRYREIVARVGAVLRRPPALVTTSGVPLRAGELELDLRDRVIRRDGRETRLSPREFDLLAVLMANPGAPLTYTKLARSAWRDVAPQNREYLRTYIQSLRQKLEDDPARPQYILTEPWVGYRFCDASAADLT